MRQINQFSKWQHYKNVCSHDICCSLRSHVHASFLYDNLAYMLPKLLSRRLKKYASNVASSRPIGLLSHPDIWMTPTEHFGDVLCLSYVVFYFFTFEHLAPIGFHWIFFPL